MMQKASTLPEDEGDEMAKETIDTTISAECGLELSKVEETRVIGTTETKYYAQLCGLCIGAKKHTPEEILVEQAAMPHMEFEISRILYNHLMAERGEGTAFGKITVELYVRTEAPKKD